MAMSVSMAEELFHRGFSFRKYQENPRAGMRYWVDGEEWILGGKDGGLHPNDLEIVQRGTWLPDDTHLLEWLRENGFSFVLFEQGETCELQCLDRMTGSRYERTNLPVDLALYAIVRRILKNKERTFDTGQKACTGEQKWAEVQWIEADLREWMDRQEAATLLGLVAFEVEEKGISQPLLGVLASWMQIWQECELEETQVDPALARMHRRVAQALEKEGEPSLDKVQWLPCLLGFLARCLQERGKRILEEGEQSQTLSAEQVHQRIAFYLDMVNRMGLAPQIDGERKFLLLWGWTQAECVLFEQLCGEKHEN